MAIQIGNILDDKYEILKQIGKGGMSVVYLAMDRHLNKQWAVKEIRRTADEERDAVIIDSLLAEANLMKRLDHPALPRIVDILEEGEQIYIVMDYIEGESIDRVLKEYGPQPEEVVIAWAKQLCDVLGYLHTRKPPIVYRDMKPANVMLNSEGNLKVIDFGIAREYGEEKRTDTRMLGTDGYASPEQHGARQTDMRSDIYSLGMTMHQMLTGADPRSPGYLYLPIRRWNPALSKGLERVVEKCTSLHPRERYQNCGELMYALEHYEEEDGSYRKKQKRRLASFLVSAGLCVLSVLGACGMHLLGVYANNRDYDSKISISASTPYDTRVQTYLDAIDLLGADPRAYLLLLQTYEENGVFGDEQSDRFTEKYNQNRERFDTKSEAYLDLAYKAGTLYLYLYSGGDDTFRTRVLRAMPYFAEILEAGETDNVWYDMAQSYYLVGDFYSRYVLNTTSVREPNREAYETLPDALQTCLDHVEEYEQDDAAYIRLTMYREAANLLHDHRNGFAASGVGEERILSLLEEIREKTEALAVTRPVSVSMREEILAACADYDGNIRRAYAGSFDDGR